MVLLHRGGWLEVLVRDRIVLAYKNQRCLAVKVTTLAAHLLTRFGE
jgi:hypothetical protein